jgi:ABC-type Fe3+ transport system substrate-binding protein
MLLTSVGVLESSDRKPEAFAFVRSLLSDRSQAFFTSSSKEYPLARGSKPDPALSVPIEKIPVSDSSLVDLKEIQATIDLMKEAGAL